MWYGEPGIATAELSWAPVLARGNVAAPSEDWIGTLAVNVIVIRADLSPLKPEPSGTNRR